MTILVKPTPYFKHRPSLPADYDRSGYITEMKIVPSGPKSAPAQGLLNEQLTPDRAIGHIVAWRRWDLALCPTTKRPRLTSLMGFGIWPHDKPAYGEGLLDDIYGLAGINAYNCAELSRQHYRGAPLYGRVALWGRISVYEGGYRAEYGWPLTINTTSRGKITEALLLLIMEEYNIQPEQVPFNNCWYDIKPTRHYLDTEEL